MIRHPDLQRLLAKIEAAGRKVTPQRVAVCEALLALGGHPTATEIWSYLHVARPTISQATVYNTLAALEELGLIRALDVVGDEHAHYDLCVDPHVNVFCTRCGHIADIHTDTLEALLGLAASRSGYQIDSGKGVIIYGICGACQSAPAAPRQL